MPAASHKADTNGVSPASELPEQLSAMQKTVLTHLKTMEKTRVRILKLVDIQSTNNGRTPTDFLRNNFF